MTGFQLRAPWYVRERGPFSDLPQTPPIPFGLRDPRALRPEIQMYDDTRFVKQLLADPRNSLAATEEDYWSYPVPITPASLLKAPAGSRLATSRLCTTHLRKLFQPSHNRFYLVVVEVFCDEPGLPRAGAHDDLQVSFVMRRQVTAVHGARGQVRKLARNLLVELMKEQYPDLKPETRPVSDIGDLLMAVRAREDFERHNAELLSAVHGESDRQAWFRTDAGRLGWKSLDSLAADEVEVELPMWRIPPADGDCAAARTRSTWFGVIPTYTAAHWTDEHGDTHPQLDEHEIYELTCKVRQKLAPGHEHCPQPVYSSAATEPFRLAAAMDPDGTSKRTTTITLPDLRALAARAAKPKTPGGVRIATPAQSQLSFNPFNGIPAGGSGSIGAGGGVCTFALELFFIVAFFLFLLFLPIVILAFQLWWMLALRFCIPPSIAFKALADYFAATNLGAADAAHKTQLDLALGFDATQLLPPNNTPGWAAKLDGAVDPKTGLPIFDTDKALVSAVVHGADPDHAKQPVPRPVEPLPADPLC